MKKLNKIHKNLQKKISNLITNKTEILKSNSNFKNLYTQLIKTVIIQIYI